MVKYSSREKGSSTLYYLRPPPLPHTPFPPSPLEYVNHKVYRVPGIFSSRPGLVPLPPHPQGTVAPAPFGSKGEDTLACGGGGMGGPKTTNRLVLFEYYYPSTI
jgi:hypothetical protein